MGVSEGSNAVVYWATHNLESLDLRNRSQAPCHWAIRPVVLECEEVRI